ncbi:MAG: MmgE/PrpD family protein, partial [Anaerolineae bacterium]
MSATGRLARHVAQTRYGDLPPEVVRQAKDAIRDSLGCLLGGSTLEAGQRLCNLLLPMAAQGRATVTGMAGRVPPPLAGYLNAQLANMLDFDDTFSEGFLGHPGATIVPAALAMAEEIGASGKDLLSAVVVGYDVCSRVGVAGRPTFERSKQVRGMATWQVFGAAAAAAHVMDLDAETVARAFGLAALHAPVPSVGKIYEERPMWALKNNFGWATQGAILGVMFAAEGFDGNHRILEGATGFWSMAGSDQVDPSALTAGLGSHYSLLDTSFKPYPCCRFTHSALDALGQIVRSAQLSVSQVREVRIRSSSKI